MTRTNIKELAKQTFIGIPKLLLYGEKYKNLSGNAFKTYTALYDRFTLSVKNNWLDEDGSIYFVYDLEDLSRITGIGKTALTSARKQLKEAGLLEEVSTGRNNRLYLGLPKPKNKEEAKFIMYDEDEIEDTSKISEEEKALRSRNARNNQNAKKTDDSSKRTIVRKTPSYQQNDDLEKQTIVQNVLSDSLKRTTSDTNLMKLSKDIKDNKDQADSQNQQITNQFSKHEKDNEQELIEQYIDENELVSAYGQQTIQLVKNYSFSDLEQFKVYIDKFYFGWKSTEKDTGIKINPYEKTALHDELASTFKRVIIQFKQGKTKNINNYLYVSLKNVFKDYAETQQENNTDLPPVPLDKWLK
ncbi:replication initiator protein A [Aerococcus urinaeequi]|uniref:replication initiator protein A n=1 Tax=Aerococcus urinaeequi TaxID=51665 RepID=UPI003D6B9EF3